MFLLEFFCLLVPLDILSGSSLLSLVMEEAQITHHKREAVLPLRLLGVKSGQRTKAAMWDGEAENAGKAEPLVHVLLKQCKTVDRQVQSHRKRVCVHQALSVLSLLSAC